jgi:indole-3-glycerol phosphate synthase
LGRLVQEAAARALELEGRRAELAAAAERRAAAPSLAHALRRDHVAIIAEVKRRSPSKGDIAPGLSAEAQAKAYERGGASAVSVLTESGSFGGSPRDLTDVVSAVRLPVLRKDFIVSALQLMEARAWGASAALLIARALEPALLASLAFEARRLGVETLIEVRDRAELERALDAGADVIGVNNRDLETLEIHPDTAVRLLPEVPSRIPAVAESGVQGVSDVERFAAAGADAVLVGSSISGSSDPTMAVRQLASVARRARGA